MGSSASFAGFLFTFIARKMMFMEYLFFITGVLAGIAGAWLFFRARSLNPDNPAQQTIRALSEEVQKLTLKAEADGNRINNLTAEVEKARSLAGEKEQKILELTANLATKTSEHDHLLEKLNSQKEELENIRERFTTEFKNLAGEIMEQNSKKFTEQNRHNLDELLQPLGEKIKSFEKKVEDVYVKEAQHRFSLKEEVARLADLNRKVSEEAHNLAQALKGESKTQGNWGELILENILEKSGLTKEREYFVQKSFTGDNGKRLQPDVVVTYPGNKNVVIDSKVSLTAYEKYSSANDEETREQAIKEHLISVRRHIDELHTKNYQHIYELNSLDFVMMFMPVEPAFLLAIQHDAGLWSYAYDKGILLISPTNLIAALKMVAAMWKQEYQNKNVLEIARESGKLYDKFVNFVNDLTDVGRKLHSTQQSYEDSMKKLSEGKGNLISRVEAIKKLGAKASKELPKTIVNKSDEN